VRKAEPRPHPNLSPPLRAALLSYLGLPIARIPRLVPRTDQLLIANIVFVNREHSAVVRSAFCNQVMQRGLSHTRIHDCRPGLRSRPPSIERDGARAKGNFVVVGPHLEIRRSADGLRLHEKRRKGALSPPQETNASSRGEVLDLDHTVTDRIRAPGSGGPVIGRDGFRPGFTFHSFPTYT
jgi:hypothetical protein